LLKSVYICGSYCKIKTGVSLFWTTRYRQRSAAIPYVVRSRIGYHFQQPSLLAFCLFLCGQWDIQTNVWDAIRNV